MSVEVNYCSSFAMELRLADDIAQLSESFSSHVSETEENTRFE